ncbi:MAG: ice-binding family protein [Gammaproteobacteria bacterium]
MNIMKKYCSLPLGFTVLLLAAFINGCSSDSGTSTAVTTNPAALTVTSTNPADDATTVATNQKITATFSESMESTSLDGVSFTVKGAGEAAIVGTVSLDAASNTAIFTPGSTLTPSIVYTATITTAAESSTGKSMASNNVWSFTSGAATDSVAPTVSSTAPANTATDFYLNRNITAAFDESLNPATVSATSFTLIETVSTNAVSGDVSYSDTGKLVSFNPDANLTAGLNYTATLTTAIQDLAGNALASAVTWSFSGTVVSTPQAQVNLGTAEDFVILAKTAISKTGTAGTSITGDIGVSPIAQTAITGFSETLDASNTFATSSYVTGSIYAADMTAPTPTKMSTAVSDMELAFTDAAGRTLPDFTELGAGNISGMTLAPGLYKWGTNVLITNAGVTISGSATDVWIFQIAQDLIVDNAAIVTLAGGALPENIFWQVEGGTGVSIGTTAQFKGVVLAQKAITVNTGATVNGRLLAQTAVTLDGNAVAQP